MPVGTYGAVKAMSPDEVAATGAQIVLGPSTCGCGRGSR
jgi:queuine/archaeosine tRNA-ribosyltransferase